VVVKGVNGSGAKSRFSGMESERQGISPVARPGAARTDSRVGSQQGSDRLRALALGQLEPRAAGD